MHPILTQTLLPKTTQQEQTAASDVLHDPAMEENNVLSFAAIFADEGTQAEPKITAESMPQLPQPETPLSEETDPSVKVDDALIEKDPKLGHEPRMPTVGFEQQTRTPKTTPSPQKEPQTEPATPHIISETPVQKIDQIPEKQSADQPKPNIAETAIRASTISGVSYATNGDAETLLTPRENRVPHQSNDMPIAKGLTVARVPTQSLHTPAPLPVQSTHEKAQKIVNVATTETTIAVAQQQNAPAPKQARLNETATLPFKPAASNRIERRGDRTLTPPSVAPPQTLAPNTQKGRAAQPMLNVSQPETAKLVSLEVDAPATMRSETIATTTTTTSYTQPIPTRMDMPQHVARQIAEVLQHIPNRPVEISLNPEELGRVRLGISASEGAITVSILAERPETTDLMRRHISALETAFADLGFSTINFAFGGGTDTQSDAETQDQNRATDTPSIIDEGLPDATRLHLTTAPITGLDIRL